MSLQTEKPNRNNLDTMSVVSESSVSLDRYFARQLLDEVVSRDGHSRTSTIRHVLKILIFQIIPQIVLVIITAITLQDTIQSLEEAELIGLQVHRNQIIGDLVSALQVERGLSSGYLSTNHANRNDDDDVAVLMEVNQARLRTDLASDVLDFWPDDGLDVPHLGLTFSTKDEFEDAIGFHRLEHVEVNSKTGNTSIRHNIEFYTSLNMALMLMGVQASLQNNQHDLWPLIVASDHLMLSSDLFGIVRALGSVHYGSCKLSDEYLRWFIQVVAKGDVVLSQAFRYHEQVQEKYDAALKANEEAVRNVAAMKTEILNGFDTCSRYGSDNAGERSLQWFTNITHVINALSSVHEDISQMINNLSQDIIYIDRVSVTLHVIAVVVVVIGCLVLGVYYAQQLYKLVSTIGRYAQQLTDRKNTIVAEKKKSEKLLYQMLPRSVAEQLKRGRAVKAEIVPNVTIYYSDIVDFTEMVADTTPMEVVDILNGVYRYRIM